LFPDEIRFASASRRGVARGLFWPGWILEFMNELIRKDRSIGRSPFDDIRHVEEDGTEWWSARELMAPLGYERWENLLNVIDRAKSACRNTGHDVGENFRDVTKVIGRRGPTARDVHMTRFAAYLLAMNGDPNKPEIAAAQRYFTVQTRRAELGLPASGSGPVVPVRPWSERLTETFQEHRLHVVRFFPFGSFTTYTATSTEILMIEDELLRSKVPVQYKDLPDGSIGRRWSDYRKDQAWPDPIGWAPLSMPHINYGGSPFVAQVMVYDSDLRPYFDQWLNEVYIPDNMPDYFAHKKEWKDIRPTVAGAADQASLRLTGKPATLPDKQRAALQLATAKRKAVGPAP
jgi:hypothetical protein